MFIRDKRFRGFVFVLALMILMALLESGRRRFRRPGRAVPAKSGTNSVAPVAPPGHTDLGMGGMSIMSDSNEHSVQTVTFSDDGIFPNNPELPLILYRRVLPSGEDGSVPTECIYSMIEDHGWGHSWSNGIFNYHHYHSTAHEVLFIQRGNVTIQFGGPQGEHYTVHAGDVVVIPVGVSHKNVQADTELNVIGAYPPGQRYDMCYGKTGERPQADRNIKSVALPLEDPVYGEGGPLQRYWKQEQP